MNNYQILQDAADMIDMYRYPELDVARELLNKILSQTGNGTIHYSDTIDGIRFSESGMVEVDTSYTSRGCAMNYTYSFPANLLDSEDVGSAAKEWKYQENIKNARSNVEYAELALNRAREVLQNLEKEKK